MTDNGINKTNNIFKIDFEMIIEKNYLSPKVAKIILLILVIIISPTPSPPEKKKKKEQTVILLVPPPKKTKTLNSKSKIMNLQP